MPSMAAFGGNESCPNCGARMAADQRYCLNCGHRRGEPRLPFMDAVVFMESMNSAPGGAGGATPPPPPAQSGGGSSNKWNANAALIAGVATLVLAIGVGFLIGRTGHNDNSSAGNGGEVKVVQVGGAPVAGGEAEAPVETETSTPEGGGEKTGGAKSGGGGGGKGGGKPASEKTTSEKTNIKEGSKEEEELAAEATKETLHTKEGVQLETKVEVGGKCEKGAAGCGDNGEFTGNFFGE